MLFVKAFMLFISDSLQDEHVFELSRRITDGDELTQFGIKVLTFKEDIIKAAMYDHSNSIQAATRKLLYKWLKQQPTGQEAYINLQMGLKRAQMNQLAAQLRKWVEGIDDPLQISGERKLLQLLQPANEVWGKVMFSRVFFYPQGRGGLDSQHASSVTWPQGLGLDTS